MVTVARPEERSAIPEKPSTERSTTRPVLWASQSSTTQLVLARVTTFTTWALRPERQPRAGAGPGGSLGEYQVAPPTAEAAATDTVGGMVVAGGASVVIGGGTVVGGGAVVVIGATVVGQGDGGRGQGDGGRRDGGRLGVPSWGSPPR